MEKTKEEARFSDENHTRLSVLMSCSSPDGTAEVDQVELRMQELERERDDALEAAQENLRAGLEIRERVQELVVQLKALFP